MLKSFSWSLICFSIWTVPWKQWIMSCVLYFNTYFNSSFIQTRKIPVRSPSQAVDRFYQPAVFFMFLRDFIVHSVLLSFCAVCLTHLELLGRNSPKKASLTFPGVVGWFAKSTNTTIWASPSFPFLFHHSPYVFFSHRYIPLFCAVSTFFYLDPHISIHVSAWSHFSES